MNLNPSFNIRASSGVRWRLLPMAALIGAALIACGDEGEADICDDFARPQIIPSERPVCLNLDPTTVGQTVTRPVLLQNLGNSELQLADIQLEGNSRGHFTLQGVNPQAVTCPDAAAAGIVYEPTEPGWDTATLVVSSNAENFPNLRIFFLALAVPDDDPSYDPGPKPPEAVGEDGSETCPEP
ncbi:MAG: hypothetical protein AAF449_12790 [Myxococcota bacterium]